MVTVPKTSLCCQYKPNEKKNLRIFINNQQAETIKENAYSKNNKICVVLPVNMNRF